MRRFLLPFFLLVLAAATGWLWNHRYERIPGARPVGLADLARQHPSPGAASWSGSGQQTRLVVPAGTSPPVVRMKLADTPPVEALHLVVQVEASRLSIGRQAWDDGRLLVEWQPDGRPGAMELDPIASARGDEKKGPWELVARPVNRPALPVLRIEHLGSAGEFLITRVEATPVRERTAWKLLAPALLAGWFALAALAAGFPQGRWKALLAAGIWLVFAFEFIVPGPWKSARPMVASFQLGSEPPPAVIAPPPPPFLAATETGDGPGQGAEPEAEVRPAGRIPTAGNPVLRVKAALPRIRPILHGLLLFVPSMIALFLIPRKRVLIIAATCSGSIELAQTLFGYGFDATDLLDLLWNAAGIGLAFWIHPRLLRRFRSSPTSARAAA